MSAYSNLHPELSDLVPIYGRRLVDIKDDPDWEKLIENPDPKFQGGMREGVQTWSMMVVLKATKIILESRMIFHRYIYIPIPSFYLYRSYSYGNILPISMMKQK